MADTHYVLLLRGINVGGKNKMSMATLKACLEEQGFEDVVTYINSGNLIVRSKLDAKSVASKIETLLPQKFKLDSSIIKVLAIDGATYKKIVSQAPPDFGSDLTNYRYDVIFLMGITPADAMRQIAAREGIDHAWQGDHAIYYRRPSLTSPEATKSYLGKVTQHPIYQSITIRNWNTTTKLLTMIDERKA